MKIALFGGGGMAGHMIVDYLTSRGYDVAYTARIASEDPRCFRLDVTDHLRVEEWLRFINPDIVINATGLLNDQAAGKLREAVYVNSLFPHLLSCWGDKLGFRLIHISTDCVFSGDAGDYSENSPADGLTVYAKTKALGEVHQSPHLTIRTSIIGPELKNDGIGLFHWFMQQQGEIMGYRNVYWNGVTTLELAKAIEWTFSKPFSGLVHLAVQPKISKYSLLVLFRDIFERNDLLIQPIDTVPSNKSLVNTRQDFPYTPAPYEVMLLQLKAWMKQSGRNYPYTFN